MTNADSPAMLHLSTDHEAVAAALTAQHEALDMGALLLSLDAFIQFEVRYCAVQSQVSGLSFSETRTAVLLKSCIFAMCESCPSNSSLMHNTDQNAQFLPDWSILITLSHF